MTEIIVHLLVIFPFLVFNGWLTIQLYKRNQLRRDEKFLRYLKIRFPDSTDLTLSSVSSSDEEALNNIKEQLDELP